MTPALEKFKVIPTKDPAHLKTQARYMHLMEDVYLELSPSERYASMQRYVRSHTQLLKAKYGKDDDFETLCSKTFNYLVNTLQPDGLVRLEGIKRGRGRPSNAEKAAREAALNPGAELLQIQKERENAAPPFEEDENGDKVYHDGGEYPPDEPNPYKRDGITVTGIKELHPPPEDPDAPEDLVGDTPPRTLLDLYARWPITKSDDYMLRIERTAPKTYNGMPATGLVAEVRGRKISEKDIQRFFGGKEYKVTLYGPDPRGKIDPEGNPVIKRLTEPITITVPMVPPNILATPLIDMLGNAEGVNKESVGMMNPFGMVNAAPTTPADANMHKVNASFFGDMIKLSQAQTAEREKLTEKNTGLLVGILADSQKQQLKTVEAQAETQVKILQAEIKKLEERLRDETQAASKVATEVAKAKDQSQVAMLELVSKMGPDKEAEVRRLADHYNQQLDLLRRSHDDVLKNLRDRHDADLRRADERLKDSEAGYRTLLEQERSTARTMLEQERSTVRTMLEQERSQWTQRESSLRTQMDKQTEAERTMAQQRVQDMKERHEAELRQLNVAHERELRTLKEAQGVKDTVTEQTHKMTLSHAQQRVQDLQSDMEDLKEKLEEAQDLTTQLERAEKQASLLGYAKTDASEPKTPWERFAATAGAGIAQVLGNANEWLPAMMAQREQARAQAAANAVNAPRRLPSPTQQAQPAPQERAQRIRRAQQVQWENGAAGPTQAPQQPTREPLGFVQNPQPAPVSHQTTPPPAPEAMNPVAQAGAPSEDLGVNSIFPAKFLEHFPEPALIGFLQQAELAVNTSTPASIFADQMVKQFEPGAVLLTQHFSAQEVLEAVAGIPGSEVSPLVRKDGKKWMERLFAELKKQLAAKSEPQVVTH